MAMTTKEVKKRALLEELKDELWTWAKRRGWMLLLIGAGGIWFATEFAVQRLAETPLKQLQREVARTELQAEAAKSSSEKIKAGLTALDETLQGLGDQAKAIDLQFKLQTEQINAIAANAARRSQSDFNVVQQRIVALEALVKKIAEESEATRKAVADYGAMVAKVDAKVDAERKRFAENSEYTVSILFHPTKRAVASQIQSRLAVVGFRPSSHETPLPSKGNALVYQPASEAKAQEILALLKPLITDVQLQKAAESKFVDYKAAYADIQMGVKGPFVFMLPKAMALRLGPE